MSSWRDAKAKEGSLPTFRPRPLDVSKPLLVVHDEELLEDGSSAVTITGALSTLGTVSRGVPMMPTGMEREEEAEKHLRRAVEAMPGTTGEVAVIPIPHVRVVEVVDPGLEPWVRPQELVVFADNKAADGGEEEDDGRVEYDATESDTEWLGQQQATAGTLDALEVLVDRFEKAAAKNPSKEITRDTAGKIGAKVAKTNGGEGFAKSVFDYWMDKRKSRCKGDLLLDRFKAEPAPKDPSPYVAFRPRIEEREAAARAARKAAANRSQSRAHARDSAPISAAGGSHHGGHARGDATAAAAAAGAGTASDAECLRRLTEVRKELSMTLEILQSVVVREEEKAEQVRLVERIVERNVRALVAKGEPTTNRPGVPPRVPGVMTLAAIRNEQKRLASELLGPLACHEDDADGASDEDDDVPCGGGESSDDYEPVSLSHSEWVAHCRRVFKRNPMFTRVATAPAPAPAPALSSAPAFSTRSRQCLISNAEEEGLIRVRGAGPAFRGRARIGRGGRIIFDRMPPPEIAAPLLPPLHPMEANQ